MFCILVTVVSINAGTPPSECFGAYASLSRCNDAIVSVSRNVKPETHKGYAFRCVEQGRRS